MTTQPKEPTPGTCDTYRRAGAAIAAALTSCLFYALDRSRSVWFEPAGDPLSVIASARIPYFWRIGTSAFIGSLVWLAWLRLARRREEQSFRLAVWAIAPTIGLCALISLIWP